MLPTWFELFFRQAHDQTSERAMEDNEMISAGRPIPRLAKVWPGQGRIVSVEWSDGKVSEIDRKRVAGAVTS